MCNLYSLTKGQAAIRDWFRARRDRTGNLPLFPAIFPDQMAPIVRNGADGERELVMARWGMPGPPQFGGAPITNIRNVGSPHWRRWLAPDDAFLHAARHHRLEQLAQEIALAETAVAVLGKRRMIGDVAVEPQATEPAIGQIEVDLLAQPTLRANAEAVADNQHPHHQFGINRGPSHIAVIGPQMRPQIRQVDETVDLAKHVIVRDMPLEAEAVEQRLLHHPPLAHHHESPRFIEKLNQSRVGNASEFFNKIGRVEV